MLHRPTGIFGKKYSLQRLIPTMIISAYGLLILLLVLILIFSSINLKQKKLLALEEKGYEISNSLSISHTSMNRFLYTFYDNYKDLKADNEPSNDFFLGNNIYRDMKQRIDIESNLDGFFISVFGNQFYYIPSKHTGGSFTFVEAQNIIEKMEKIIITNNNSKTSSFLFSYGENKSVLVDSYQSDNIILYGFINVERFSEKNDLFSSVYLSDSEEKIQETSKQVQFHKIENSNFYVALVAKKSIFDYLQFAQIALIVIILISFILLAILLKFIKKNYIDSLKILRSNMEKIFDDKDTLISIDSQFVEVNEINDTFNLLISKIVTQKIEIYENRIIQQEINLEYYQNQLKPHFFLNCMKTLNAMAINNNDKESQNLIIAISDYLKYSLQTNKKVVSVKEELYLVLQYIDLQQKLTNKIISIEISKHVDENLLIPILSIQTFIENSVKYAKNQNEDLVITINIGYLVINQKKYLDIVVMDNGSGYSKTSLQELNSEINRIGNKVGIKNLLKRCSLIYERDFQSVFLNMNGAYSELILPTEPCRVMSTEMKNEF